MRRSSAASQQPIPPMGMALFFRAASKLESAPGDLDSTEADDEYHRVFTGPTGVRRDLTLAQIAKKWSQNRTRFGVTDLHIRNCNLEEVISYWGDSDDHILRKRELKKAAQEFQFQRRQSDNNFTSLGIADKVGDLTVGVAIKRQNGIGLTGCPHAGIGLHTFD